MVSQEISLKKKVMKINNHQSKLYPLQNFRFFFKAISFHEFKSNEIKINEIKSNENE